MRIGSEVAPQSSMALLAAAALAGCSSWAMQTRVTASGGAYTLFANWRDGVPEAASRSLSGIAQACGGPYEIVSLELSPHADNLNVYFVGLSGGVSFGPFDTTLGYECRAPQNLVLNERVQRIAAAAPAPQVAGPENVMAACEVDNDCDPGLICYENRCRR